jgi:FHS family glucose/mannose:H+ symporter-like MFS transporter
MPEASGKLTIGLLYFAGVVQGLALVTFPAASTIFTSPSGFNLGSAQYGAMFIPQVGMAMFAAGLGSRLALRLGLFGLLLLGLSGDLASMALLSASPLLIGTNAAFVLLYVATGALGLGFGATVTALNTLVEGLFPGRADGAVLALNALLGLGTALAPVLVALFSALGAWWALPLLTAILLAALLIAFALNAPLSVANRAAGAPRGLPPRFWLYAAAALLYGVVETLNGNWATLYLSAERGASATDASYALAAFWLTVTLGRVAFALLDRLLPARWVYVALPLLLGVVFEFVARVDGAAAGIAAFAAAGLACSAILPLTISFGGAEFPSRAATISGELIAFYQIGYGLAAFGVGPLRMLGGFAYSTAFSIGGLVALMLGAVAFLVVRDPAHAGAGGASRKPL